MENEIYIPERDSFLLQDVLKKFLESLNKDKKKNLKFLDMGSGSGILAETALEKGIEKNNIICVDINSEAVKNLKKKGFNAVKSNLFNSLDKNKNFDLIVFNPPYLPFDERESGSSRLATTGGKKGGEIINGFLSNAEDYLNENGIIFLLTSSLTKNIFWKDWEKKVIKKEKIFFEELYVWELWRKNIK